MSIVDRMEVLENDLYMESTGSTGLYLKRIGSALQLIGGFTTIVGALLEDIFVEFDVNADTGSL